MKTTFKTVQTHFQCVCGYNEVYPDKVLINWRDLAKAGIKRKKCKTSGKPFLFLMTEGKECKGHNDID